MEETGKPKGLVHSKQRGFSLRARLILAITITAVIATIAVGYFSNLQNQETQSFLGNEFQSSQTDLTEIRIRTLAEKEAQSINEIFVDASRSATSIASLASHLVSQSASFQNSPYWNASEKLSQLPNGAWDNPNSDNASIFVPSNVNLTEEQLNELNAVIQVDSIIPNVLQNNPTIAAIYYISSKEMTVYYPNIDLANLLPPDFKATEQPFYTNATPLPQNGYFWSLPYQDPALTGLIVTISSPVYDTASELRGAIGIDLQLAKITARILDIKIGETGYGFLIDNEGHIIAMPDKGYIDFQLSPEEIPVNETPQLTLLAQGPQELRPYIQIMTQGGIGFSSLQIQGVEYYLAYTPITASRYSMGVIVPVDEMNVDIRKAQALVSQENTATRNYGIALLAIIVVGATLVSFGLSQVLTNPLLQLTAAAEKVSIGDLTARAPKTSVSEVSVLTDAFNTMTSQLEQTLGNLEQRVVDRTRELDVANQYNQRRAELFEAVAQVARDISSSQDLETLLPKITNVISERFGFYHVGVFLVDANQEYAVLRAANSAGGRKMLKRKHQLKIGEIGIVGYVTSQNKARIALDTGQDAVYFDNPDLPETRSEMALPLQVGNQVIGALDVQSTEPDAFSQEDIDTLSTLADQVSVAIQNARLYEEIRNALKQSQVLQQEFIRTGWRQFTHSQKLAGIRYSGKDTTLLKSAQEIPQLNGEHILELPINLRNQMIGKIKIRTDEEHRWSQDEIDIATAILERAAIALENARLLNEAQRRAARERVIGDISASISISNDMEGILRTAVQVLGRRMGGAEVILELGAESNNDNQNQTVNAIE